MNVLLIEDDDSFRTTLAMALKRRGCEVSEAANAREALRQTQAMQAQGIVLDMRLGRDNGIDLIVQLKHDLPEARLIVLTGYGSIPSAMGSVRVIVKT